jgi:hypothetical protein
MAPIWFWHSSYCKCADRLTCRCERCRLVAAPLHIAAIGSAASLAAVSWASPGPGQRPGPSDRKLADGLLAIAATQVVYAVPP